MKLTLPQQDIYFEQLLYPNDPIYNIGAKIEIKGIINVEIFRKAYYELINQHDTYRSILIKDQENVLFQIQENHDSELGFIDFSMFENSNQEANSYMQKEFSKTFDLFGKQLLHVFTLVKVREDFYYLFSVYHHIITDGWGTSLMFQRLVQNYNEIFEFGKVETAYSFYYKDFIEDDTIYANSESYVEDKLYWLKKFQYLPENLFDKIDESVQINKSDRKELIVKREVYNLLNDLASIYKCSTLNVILAILFTYFGRKHQNEDFAIGLPVLNRSKSKYKKTVGLFMGISALRISLDFESTFESLVQDIKKQLREDYRHQRFPIGKLIKELQIFKEKDRLFNITLSYEKQNYSNNFRCTQTNVIPLSHQSERVALAIYVREFDESDDVKIDFDYNLNYFDDSKITQVINHFENLLNTVISSPNKKLKELNYLSTIENIQLFEEFNNTKIDYPAAKTVIDLFREQVVKTPQSISVKDDKKTLSYTELNRLSDKIAEYLIKNTCNELDKSPVAVLLDRSTDMIAILLGILKCGRPYIPLDPNFPKERLSYIISNSQTKVIITENDCILDNIVNIKFFRIDHILEQVNLLSGIISQAILPQDTAYIIYTSGSTGNPKGVEICHQSLVNFLTSIQKVPGITSIDTFFSVTTYSFDISILEFFLPLISGAVLFVASQDLLSNPDLIIQKIAQIEPTIIQATPSFFQMLFNASWRGDKNLKVLCGGDLLSTSLAEKLLINTLEVWNMYGPTETTIWSSLKKIEYPQHASNIGKPINNTQFYILDRFLNPLPIGAYGMIYIGGDGLAKGYYKNETLSREKFIKKPFADHGLIYETGDVGKWTENGEIEFLGRNDNQVKVRGYRIELGDIESRLNQIKGINTSIVIANKRDKQEAFLVAYVLKELEVINVQNIIKELRLTLPYYMIPNNIVVLDKFPLTPNQKVDRKALLQMEVHQIINEDNFKKPSSELEKVMIDYWSEALGIKDVISVDINFFAIGGHSLNAVKLIGLIKKNLSIDISFRTIFEYPTIELLSAYLEEQTAVKFDEIEKAEVKELYELTPSQSAIWLASQQENISLAYNMSAAFSLEGNADRSKIEKVLKDLIRKHEILRTNFVELGGSVYQKINDFGANRFSITVIDTIQSELDAELSKFVNTEFNLENDLLLRVLLFKLENKKMILLFCTHHIILDGISLELFIKEFISSYNSENQSCIEHSYELKFTDYSEWLNKKIGSISIKNRLFWKNYLENYQYKESFEKDYNSKNNKQRAREYLFELDERTTLSLKKVALNEKVTLYTILIASLNVIIFNESGQTDICIGTVNSGRNMSQLDSQLGIFVKTLILRTKIDKNLIFSNLLRDVQNDLFKIDEFIDMPFDKISKSIFDVMLAYQNPEFSNESIIELDDCKLIKYPIIDRYSRIPIVFNFYEHEKKLKCIIDYNSDLFQEETIVYSACAFSYVLSQICEKAEQKIGLVKNYPIELIKIASNDFDFNF